MHNHLTTLSQQFFLISAIRWRKTLSSKLERSMHSFSCFMLIFIIIERDSNLPVIKTKIEQISSGINRMNPPKAVDRRRAKSVCPTSIPAMHRHRNSRMIPRTMIHIRGQCTFKAYLLMMEPSLCDAVLLGMTEFDVVWNEINRKIRVCWNVFLHWSKRKKEEKEKILHSTSIRETQEIKSLGKDNWCYCFRLFNIFFLSLRLPRFFKAFEVLCRQIDSRQE